MNIRTNVSEETLELKRVNSSKVDADSFPVPTYLLFKGDERLGRNDVKVAGQTGKRYVQVCTSSKIPKIGEIAVFAKMN